MTRPSKQQKQIQFLQNRLTPYFLILLFSGATSCMRLYLLPDWSGWWHLAAFCGQAMALTAVWRLIKWLNRRLEPRLPFEQGPLQRIFIQVVLTLAIAAIPAWLVLHVARPYFPAFVTRQFIAVGLMLFTVVVFLFNFSFYAAYFFKNWQQSVEEKASLEVQAAGLEREKLMLQYHQLRNQVNPHYLFNTLTSLDGLIQTDPGLASEFVRHMAKVYRYVLQHKESEVVSLEEELAFIGHYLKLLQIRYNGGLRIHQQVSPDALEKGIVMVTLQQLIDNAVKHNTVQQATPLELTIRDEDGYLIVSNGKQLRRQIETSNRQGLQQLRQLYQYLSPLPVVVEDEADRFTIKIPLL